MVRLLISRIRYHWTLLIIIIFFSSCFRFNDTENSVQPSFDLSNISFDQQTYPVVILGGGIAGLTAALYCSQANVPCMVIEGPKPGGALAQSHSVRNWPGMIQAPGIDITNALRKQVVGGGVSIINEQVVNVDFKQWPRIIQTQLIGSNDTQKKEYKGLAVIIATGTNPNYLNIPGEKEYWGKGVSNCAVCEGSLYKGKDIIVIGGGDAAIAEADYLADIARKVSIIVRKDFFRAKDVKIKDRVLARPNVEVLFNTEARQIDGDGSKVTQATLYNNKTATDTKFLVDGVFLAIGSRPNSDLFKDQLSLDKNGFIMLNKNQETSIKGIYAAGDVSDPKFVQAVTAASDGCKSTLDALKFLKEIGFEIKNTDQIAQQSQQQKVDFAEKKVIEITSTEDFNHLVVQAKKPVIVDFFTTWCIPCQSMLPIIDNLAGIFKNDVLIVKINAANKSFEVNELMGQIKGAQIQSVPTFVFIKEGKEVDRLLGVQSLELFKKKIATVFGIEN